MINIKKFHLFEMNNYFIKISPNVYHYELIKVGISLKEFEKIKSMLSDIIKDNKIDLTTKNGCDEIIATTFVKKNSEYSGYKKLSINKCEDDYWIINIERLMGWNSFYKCDQIDGLEDFINNDLLFLLGSL